MPRSNIEVDTTRLDRILRNLPGNVADNVRAIAFNVEGKSKVNAPVDTGALRASHYTKTYDGAQQNGSSASEAQIANTVRGMNEAEFVPLPTPANANEAYVGPSVNYAIDVHYGTTRMTGRPYLADAVRDAENELEAAGRRICTDGR
jgi:hypothetical protein